MIDSIPLLKIIPIFIVALASPGPDFFLISSLTLSRGRVAGVLGALGISIGNSLWSALCVFGLGAILNQIHWLVFAVRMVGGLYLVYLGVQLWRSHGISGTDEQSKITLSYKKKNPLVIGFITNMTNPKALAFFTSIFAVTLTPDTNFATQATMTAVMGFVSLLWFSFVTVVLSLPVIRRSYVKGSKWIDRIAGTFLAFFGVRLLWSGSH